MKIIFQQILLKRMQFLIFASSISDIWILLLYFSLNEKRKTVSTPVIFVIASARLKLLKIAILKIYERSLNETSYIDYTVSKFEKGKEYKKKVTITIQSIGIFFKKYCTIRTLLFQFSERTFDLKSIAKLEENIYKRNQPLHRRSISSVNSFKITLEIYSKLRRTTLIYSWLYRLASRESSSASEQLSMTRSIVPWWKLKIDRTENPGGQTSQRNKGWWLRKVQRVAENGSPSIHPSIGLSAVSKFGSADCSASSTSFPFIFLGSLWNVLLQRWLRHRWWITG